MNAGSVLSLFTGAMGLDLGLEQAGFLTKVAVDNDPWALKTVRANRPRAVAWQWELGGTEPLDVGLLVKKGRFRRGVTIVAGASPCEPFSTVGKRLSIGDSRASLIGEFLRVVQESECEYFVYENVAGLRSAAKVHLPFAERVAMRPEDVPIDARPGSAFEDIIQAFHDTGYAVNWDILDAADYGVPQHRRRLIVVGAREGAPPLLPEPTHAQPRSLEVSRGLKAPWVTLRAALKGYRDPYPEHGKFPKWGKFLKRIPPGGCWKNLPARLQEAAIGGAFRSTGGRTGFLRRMAWERPAPTLVDSPTTRAACLCHPAETRPLTVGEYLRLQGFPRDWVVEGPISAKYRLLGQATPVQLGAAIGVEIRRRKLGRVHAGRRAA